MTKRYYITWSETKNKITTDYWQVRCGRTAKEVRKRMVFEQAYRKQIKKPHMFHLKVSLMVPYDSDTRRIGNFYY